MHATTDGGPRVTGRRRRHRKGLALLAILALAGTAACGDDDDDDASTSGSDVEQDEAEDSAAEDDGADLDAYCEAVLGLETSPPPDIDFESATPEEIAAGLSDYAQNVMRPLADDVLAAAPAELDEDLAAVNAALTEMEETGDFAAFEQPEAAEASARLHVFDLDNCGWTTTEVTLSNYVFEGIPAEMEAGVTSFELTNDGTDVHELALARKNDGVTETAEELLALPEEEVMTKITMVGFPPLVSPGDSGYAVVDLEPGDYIAVCFLPVGMISQEAPPPQDAPPHVAQGMVAEFTVTE